MGKKLPKQFDFRDVSAGIQKIREILLGRKYVYHNRFPPLISPRSIPPPDVPRGPEYKYSDQWYGSRNALNSVSPPVVAPIAEGLYTGSKSGKVKCDPKSMDTQAIDFPCPPTPGPAWWFDGHCYTKHVRVKPCGPFPAPPPCPPPPPCPEPPPPCPEVKVDPCAEAPPCKLQPCEPDPPPPPPPPKPCDPCVDPNKSKGGKDEC